MQLKQGAILAMAMGLATSSHATGFAVTPKIGTLGLGIEATSAISESLNIRAGINTFSYDYSSTESGIDYDFDLDLKSVAAMLDWHPFSNGFRVTGGALYNGNELSARAAPSDSFDIGGTIYTPAEVGTLTGDIDFRKTAPYLGIGWGNPLAPGSKWTVSLDLGIMFQGAADVDYTATGALSTDPAFLADLDTERAELEDALDNFEYYPVASIGVSYRF